MNVFSPGETLQMFLPCSLPSDAVTTAVFLLLPLQSLKCISLNPIYPPLAELSMCDFFLCRCAVRPTIFAAPST